MSLSSARCVGQVARVGRKGENSSHGCRLEVWRAKPAKPSVWMILRGVECGSLRRQNRPPARHDPRRAAHRDSEPEAQAKKGSSWGGALAGAIGGGSVGSPRWERIFSTTAVSVMKAITRRRLPQCSQTRTSISNTWLS